MKEYINPTGHNFFIPDSTAPKADVPDLEPDLTDDEKFAAWFESEAEKQRYNDEINFPTNINKYK